MVILFFFIYPGDCKNNDKGTIIMKELAVAWQKFGSCNCHRPHRCNTSARYANSIFVCVIPSLRSPKLMLIPTNVLLKVSVQAKVKFQETAPTSLRMVLFSGSNSSSSSSGGSSTVVCYYYDISWSIFRSLSDKWVVLKMYVIDLLSNDWIHIFNYNHTSWNFGHRFPFTNAVQLGSEAKGVWGARDTTVWRKELDFPNEVFPSLLCPSGLRGLLSTPSPRSAAPTPIPNHLRAALT